MKAGEGVVRRALPAWLVSYQRKWLRRDLIAGVVVWSVVVPQAIAYGQIAGLPPEAGLMAAPGALIGYALLGTSRTLIVSATTATSALSAAAVAPLAHGDVVLFAELSAALAVLAGIILVLGGVLGLGAISDFVSKPVMIGFLFGLGLVIIGKQLPALFGAPSGSNVIDSVSDAQLVTTIVGLASIVALFALKRFAPRAPGMSIIVVAAIVVSAVLSLSSHGVDVVGHVPRALPEPSWPDISASNWLALLAPAFGLLVLSAEAVGVSRGLAAKDHYEVDTSRDLSAMGVSNLLAGFSSGFAQLGGASQTAAASDAGARTQLTSLVAAVLILLTGAFLGPLFTDLPQAALAGIVIVAVSGFLNVSEIRRMATLRAGAVVLTLLALIGVLTLGVLPGLIVTASISLVLVLKRMSRPTVTVEDGVVTPHGPLFYANAHAVREQLVAAGPGAVLDLRHSYDLDVETLDMLGEVNVKVINVHPRAQKMLERAGIAHLSGAD